MTKLFTSNNINVKYKLQLMKKIYNIIDSELILRTNNHKLSRIWEVGTSSNITEAPTIFTTKAALEKTITVNGSVL
jgi:hypothetical protein